MLSRNKTLGHVWEGLFCLLSTSFAAQGIAQAVTSGDVRDGKDTSIYTVSTYDPERNAAQDLADTIQKAKSQGKRIILEIGGQW